MSSIVDYQQAFEGDTELIASIPDEAQLTAWASLVLNYLETGEKELTIRFVDSDESQSLNHEYRRQGQANQCAVFSF